MLNISVSSFTLRNSKFNSIFAMFTNSKIWLFVGIAAFVWACAESPQKEVNQTSSMQTCDSLPNQNLGIEAAKPMAMMMRAMYKQGEELKKQLIAGEIPDSTAYAFLHFHTVEPTNAKVLEPNFYAKAEAFRNAYEAIFKSSTPELRIESYNIMVSACVNCHEDYCTGPIKKINKLTVSLP